MLSATYLIPLLPLVGFGLLILLGRRLGDPWAGWLATLAVTASFVASIVVWAGLLDLPSRSRHFTQSIFSWVPVGGLQVKVSFLVDPLSITMALFVTGVSALIHLYSIGYMKRDENYSRYFVYLNLFVFSMLVLVMADNFLFSFLGWEGVGLCSYLLIAHWFERETAASAGQKAFVFNRVGDVGFLIAMFLIFGATGTLTYRGVFAHAVGLNPTTATAICLLLFMGATGKSAQIPLFTWLPDAMEGPTPVSALIHAATMVTAGVYLMARINPLLIHTAATQDVIAIVGVATAFIAATIACAQQDIKRVLAYSTVSQLGYMFLAVGARAYTAAIFLMIAHAFYKALLFLSAGSVIHGMNDEQDLKLMGGLRRFLPVTFVCFLVGWLAIAGVPPLSGFWSKGDVLINAFTKNPALWAVGAVTALLTAYYMGREFFLVFYGKQRWSHAQPASQVATTSPAGPPSSTGAASQVAAASAPAAQEREPHDLHPPHDLAPHDPAWVMTVPMVLLAVLAAVGGLVNLPFHPGWTVLENFLAPVTGLFSNHHNTSVPTEWVLEVIDAVLAIVGVTLAARVWGRRSDIPALEPDLLQEGWLIDYGIDRLVGRPGEALAAFSSAVVEARVIDGAVNGIATLVRSTGSRLRSVQTGYVRNYALGITLGLVLILAFVLTRAGS